MRRLVAAAVLIGFGLLVAGSAPAAVWTGLGTDNLWSNGANWSGGVPNAVDAVADFTANTTNNTVDLTGGFTVGTVVFGLNASSGNQISGSSTTSCRATCSRSR